MRLRNLAETVVVVGCSVLAAGACRADGFDGVWRSLGYGQVLEISGQTVRVYQEVGGRVLESRVEQARREGTRFEFEIVPFSYRSQFEMSLAGNMLALSELDTGREFVFERLDGLPQQDVRSHDLALNLEYFLQMFGDLYPAFEDRGVDWAGVSRRLREKASGGLDDERLFALIREGLDALGRDGHVGVQGPGGERHSPGRREAPEMIRGPNVQRQLELIREKYLSGEVRETANGKIFYGWSAPGVAYVNVRAVEGMAQDPAIAAQRTSLAAALDELAEAFTEARGVILDLRHNGGGFDALSLMIAGLFADAEQVAFSKRARIQGTDRFTEPRLFAVVPRARSLAGRPLWVLTGPGTASGAEILVMATMQFPGTRRLGAPTMGILSDTFVRELPNGWTVRLYSERYFTFDGGTYEGSGIPPHEPIPFGVEDLEHGRDPVLEAALREASATAPLRSSGGPGSRPLAVMTIQVDGTHWSASRVLTGPGQ